MPQLVFSSRTSMGIKEAQQLQLDIEKDLHEQLEVCLMPWNLEIPSKPVVMFLKLDRSNASYANGKVIKFFFGWEASHFMYFTHLKQIQRNLQLQNEENGRQLKLMLEQQQKTNKSVP